MDARDGGDKSETADYTEDYYTEPPAGAYQPSAPPAQARPLPPVPEASGGAIQGQSHTRETGDVNRVADGMFVCLLGF